MFAWKSSDLTGVSPKVAIHSLNMSPDAKPVKQKGRHLGAEKDQIIENEVRKLLESGHIRRIHFLSWLANAVLFKKSENKWRICISTRHAQKTTIRSHGLTSWSIQRQDVRFLV